MRVTADTNIIISAFFWQGNPRRVLDAARDGIIVLFTSSALLDELEDVLYRERFAERLLAARVTVPELVDGYASLATVIEPDPIDPVITRDPDDDAVLACAISAQCEIVVSGDDDLLSIKSHQDIRIVTAADLLAELYLSID